MMEPSDKPQGTIIFIFVPNILHIYSDSLYIHSIQTNDTVTCRCSLRVELGR